eukprot:1180623-Prorocentrum_minimum.AAC.4
MNHPTLALATGDLSALGTTLALRDARASRCAPAALAITGVDIATAAIVCTMSLTFSNDRTRLR